MYPYSIFPNSAIQPGNTMSDAFLSLGIASFLDACRFAHELPYRYNSDKDDPLILFKERFGSCTTKHATIATLAKELGLPVYRGMGIYGMNEAIVTGAGRITAEHKIPYIPMIHCFLVYDGKRVDLTEGNRNGKNGPITDFLFTQIVDAKISQKSEYLVYRKALADLTSSRPELKGSDIKVLLHAREDGIKLLRANIGQP
jgi:hypothetical protein